MASFFITGTDTGIGKTWFTCWLVRAWLAARCYTAAALSNQFPPVIAKTPNFCARLPAISCPLMKSIPFIFANLLHHSLPPARKIVPSIFPH